MTERKSELESKIESFILENYPDGRIVEVGNDLTRKPISAISPQFRKVAEGKDLLVFEKGRIEARYVIRKKSTISKSINLPSEISVPEYHKLDDNYEIFGVPVDSVYMGLFDINRLSSQEGTQLIIKMHNIKSQIVKANMNLMNSLKENYGNSQLEDFLVGSVMGSSIIFIG